MVCFLLLSFMLAVVPVDCLLKQRSVVVRPTTPNPVNLVGPFVVPPAALPSAPYAPWAHHHWVWYNGHHQNQSLNLNLAADYLAHDIPVGAIICDDGWQTFPNTFKPNPARFSDFSSMIDQLHQKGLRVILWTTSVLNNNAPGWAEAKAKNYFLNEGETLTWWGGHASWLDYFNPSALEWWHKQQEQVISQIDGWKCDGTDPYIFKFIIPYSSTAGPISERDYADRYYRDYLFHLRKFNRDALIMARPVNDYWSFAPHNVMFSGWVGDNDPDFTGMKWALNDILHSAWRNYLNFGSDTGGYRNGVRTRIVLLRWAQLNCFLPLFENGGDREHRPWRFGNPNETVAIYRKYVNIHMSLNPYLLSSGYRGFVSNQSQLRPMGEDIGGVYPTSFSYRLGVPGDLFVHPITEPGSSNGTVSLDVRFPTGPANWVFFDPKRQGTDAPYSGGSTHHFTFPLDQFPAFKRAGAMIPLHVQHGDSSGQGSGVLGKNRLSLIVDGELNESESIEVHEWQGVGLKAGYKFDSGSGQLRLTVSASVTVDGSGDAAWSGEQIGKKGGSGTRGLVIRFRGGSRGQKFRTVKERRLSVNDSLSWFPLPFVDSLEETVVDRPYTESGCSDSGRVYRSTAVSSAFSVEKGNVAIVLDGCRLSYGIELLIL